MLKATDVLHFDMADSDDDFELERAIALSLQEQSHSSNPKAVVNLVDDDDEDEGQPVAPATQTSQPEDMPQTRAGLNSMLGLNRKVMEEERLARKRKLVSISPPPPRKAPKFELSTTDITNPSDSCRIHNSVSNRSHEKSASTASVGATSSIAPKSSGLTFPKSVVKKTWAFRHARKGDDIKIEEVFQRDDLILAVLSSFQWDVEWLIGKLNMQKTQIVMVMQAKEEATKAQYRRETASMPNLRLCFPPMEGQVKCMHSKLMLLSHPSFLRIVVPTANLVPYDWGEDGVMENSAFIIDLPRLPESQSMAEPEMSFFGQELIYFLKAKGLDPKIVQSIYNFDFTETRDLAFVHTIGGAHIGDAWQRTGYCGLGRAIKTLNLNTTQSLSIDFVTSSIGSLNYDFISAVYLAAQGDDGKLEHSRRAMMQSKSKKDQHGRDKARAEQQRLIETVRSNFRIYFPTYDTVAKSTGGADCGGTICFQSKWYTSPTFPRELLRDCRSVREGMLMHNKVVSNISSLLSRVERPLLRPRWLAG